MMPEKEFRELEPLYEQARREIPTMPVISISTVQRRYMLGYNRAARLLESLADYGVLDYEFATGKYSRPSAGESHGD